MGEQQNEETATSKNEQQGLGCFTFVVVVFFVIWLIQTVSFITHPPLDVIGLTLITLLFGVMLFLYSLPGRRFLSKYPILARSLVPIYALDSLYLLLKQFPLNSPQMLFALCATCIYVFTQTPWFKYVLTWFHFVLIFLIVVGGAINIYPLLLSHPINYGKILSVLAVCIGLLLFLLLSRNLLQRLSTQVREGQAIQFSLGHSKFPQNETIPSQKPTADIRLFGGVRLQIFRSGRLIIWKIRHVD